MTIRVLLSQDERAALEKLAWAERRRANQQAALIVRRELQRLGLLAAEGNGAGDVKSTALVAEVSAEHEPQPA